MGCCSTTVWWNTPEPIHAYYLSIISVVITFFAALMGLLAYLPSGSSLVLSWGLENVVDLLSSAVVLWRFYNPGTTEKRVLLLKKREKRASVAISLILFILGIGVIVSSMIDFKAGGEDEDENELSEDVIIVVSLLFTIIFFVLTVVKLQMSIQLDSRALLKDGYCSLFGTILACSLFLNSIIIKTIPPLWWLDPLISLVVGVASLFLGLRSVMIQTCEKKIPIWNPKWWIFSQGNVTMDEMNEMDEESQKQQQEQPVSSSPPILYEDLDSKKAGDDTGTLTDLSLEDEGKETELTQMEEKEGKESKESANVETHTIL